ncbi:hypothetical protein BDD12DRAFT_804785 [Trichophaea hybrida]|nr:hypothetical protein BDD12DRAFT_804785 [Trichophaea hybrida]
MVQALNIKLVHLVIHFQESNIPWPLIRWHMLYIGHTIRVAGEIRQVDPQLQLRETAGFHPQTQQIVNQFGDYEKLPDFTRMLKFQQLINQFDDYKKLLDFTRRLKFQQIIHQFDYKKLHSLSISAQSPTVMPRAVKSSAWPAQFLKSNGFIRPSLRAGPACREH